MTTSSLTLSDIALHLALSRTAVRDLEIEGVLDRTAGIDACRLAYIRHLRTRRSNSGDDRLRLARAQAIELRTLREAHELVRADEMFGVIDAAIGTLIVHLNMVPTRCTRDIEMREIIESEINRARTAAADEYERQANSIGRTGKAAAPTSP